jgi:hypothetical protein
MYLGRIVETGPAADRLPVPSSLPPPLRAVS